MFRAPPTLRGLVDLHSHHLPGLDDGPRTLDASLEQVRALGEAGYEILVCTPHVIERHYEHDRETLDSAVAALERALGSGPRLLVGAEHRFDGRFLALLEEDRLVPLGGRGRAVLVEFAWPKLPANVLEVLYRIQIKGWLPLMAHPDRYANDEEDYVRLGTWVERGGLLQVELGSLVGRYGSAAHSACRRLLEEDLVHVAAADVHRPEDVDAIVRPGWSALVGEVGEQRARRLCAENPRALLERAA